MQDRYQGKPLLIFLENLVLHSIGQLGQEQYAQLDSMEEFLHEVYHCEGDWVTILKAELRLPADFEEQVRAVWNRNCALAERQGLKIDPVDFARAFVDAHFDHE